MYVYEDAERKRDWCHSRSGEREKNGGEIGTKTDENKKKRAKKEREREREREGRNVVG